MTVGSRPGPQPMSWVRNVNDCGQPPGLRDCPAYARLCSTLVSTVWSISFRPFTKTVGPPPTAANRRRVSDPCPVYALLCLVYARPSSTCGPSLIPTYIVQTVHKSARATAGPPRAAAGRPLPPPGASRALPRASLKKLPKKWCLYLLTIYYS
jgi:hypothetical protein